ncbi:MAG: hypothetical protein Q8Q06_00895 [bacterium]|nr:hypothetical protein [bacterium]
MGEVVSKDFRFSFYEQEYRATVSGRFVYIDLAMRDRRPIDYISTFVVPALLATFEKEFNVIISNYLVESDRQKTVREIWLTLDKPCETLQA